MLLALANYADTMKKIVVHGGECRLRREGDDILFGQLISN